MVLVLRLCVRTRLIQTASPRQPRLKTEGVGHIATEDEGHVGPGRPGPLALDQQGTFLGPEWTVTVGAVVDLVHDVVVVVLLVVVAVEQQLDQLLGCGPVRHQQGLVLRPRHEDGVVDPQKSSSTDADAEARLASRATLLQLCGTGVVLQHQQAPRWGASARGSNHHLHRHEEQVGVAVPQAELGQDHQNHLAAGGRGRQAHRLVLDVGA